MGGDSPAAILFDAYGNPVEVVHDADGYRLLAQIKTQDSGGSVIDPATETTLDGIKSNQESVLDSGNSSTSQLGNGGTFVGTGVDCLGYASVAVTVHSDEDSATDGMKFEFSMDNSNWDDTYSWTLDASSSETRRFQFPVTARYFRVNYTNGSQATAEFRCQTILHRQNILTSIHRLKDNASSDRSAQVMKSAIIAQRAGGPSTDFIPVSADPGGNLLVVDEDVLAAVEGIRDTDGIKKITDALPAGDNIIGRTKITDGTEVVEVVIDGYDGYAKLPVMARLISSPSEVGTVAQGTKAPGSGAWPTTPYDAYGVQLPVARDAPVPLETRTLLAAGMDGDNTARVLKTTSGGVLNVTIAPSFGGLVIGKLESSGGLTNMNIDGSGTPVDFDFDADPTDDLYLQTLRIILLPNVLRMDDGSFGSLSGPLTNGCLLTLTSEGVTTTLGTLKQTEDIVALPGGQLHTELGLTSNELLVVTLDFGGNVPLIGGSSDRLRMRIQDDLTAAGPNSIKHFSATASAIKME